MKELYAVLLKIQGVLKPVKKTSENPFFKSHYADLVAVDQAVRPLLTDNGILISQTTGMDERGTYLKTALIHAKSGDNISSIIPIIGSDPQKLIACLTYMRRASLATICGLVAEDEDDDGNATTDTKQTKPESHKSTEQGKMAPGPKADKNVVGTIMEVECNGDWHKYKINGIEVSAKKENLVEALTAHEGQEVSVLYSEVQSGKYLNRYVIAVEAVGEVVF